MNKPWIVEENNKISTLEEYKTKTSFDILAMLEKARSNNKAGYKYIYIWDYVTALRGPDNSSYPLKTVFTCFIRGSTYPTAMDISNWVQWFRQHNAQEATEILCKASDRVQAHWDTHMSNALKVLDKQLFEDQMQRIASNLRDLLIAVRNKDEKRIGQLFEIIQKEIG